MKKFNLEKEENIGISEKGKKIVKQMELEKGLHLISEDIVASVNPNKLEIVRENTEHYEKGYKEGQVKLLEDWLKEIGKKADKKVKNNNESHEDVYLRILFGQIQKKLIELKKEEVLN